MPRTAKITIWKKRPEEGSKKKPEWRWTWVAKNQLTIAASTEGYDSRRDAVKNLETVTGGHLTLTFKQRGPKGEFCQGHVERWKMSKDGAIESERIYVEVLP